MSDKTIYWASKEASEVAGDILIRVEEYYKYIESVGIRRIWQKSYDYMYRAYEHHGDITRAGDIGEYSIFCINHFRNFVQHLFSLTTSQRLFFEAQGTNTDLKSQEQVLLAQGILEFYLRKKQLERHMNEAALSSLLFSEGFVSPTWDARDGEDVQDENGQTIKTGEIVYNSYTPLDIVRDVTRERSTQTDWVVVRNFRNKFDLAARFPELADKIVAQSYKDEQGQARRWLKHVGYETDEIAEWTFYHRPTEAMPQGRLTTLLASDCILLDGPLPYPEIPVYRMCAGEKLGSVFGYTSAYDLLNAQDGVDLLHSTIMTNQSTFGVQAVSVPKGQSVNVTSLTKGLNLVEYDGANPPQPMNMTKTPEEIFVYKDSIIKEMETISGINSVTRGNPEENLKSGTAIALVKSSSIEFSMDTQRSYAQLAEDVGTATINMLKTYATAPRIASITGKASRPYLKSFNQDDLLNVDRVTVNLGNALLRTTAGKVNVAETLLTAGMIENPQQFLEVISTGKVEPLVENQQAELFLIRGENEKLAQGVNTPVLVTDRHDLHILEHRVVGASLEARDDPKVMAALTLHLQQHLDQARNIDPLLIALLKMNLPMPGPVPAALPPGAAPDSSQAVANINPTQEKASEVQDVRAPKIPEGTDPNTAAIVSNMMPATNKAPIQ